MENNNHFDMFGQFQEAQKNMMDSWTRMMPQFDMSAWQNAQNPMDAYRNMMDSFATSFKGYTGSPMEMFEKMMQGNLAYYNLYELYKDIYEKSVEPTQERAKTLMEDWMQKAGQFGSTYFMPYLPKEMQASLQRAMDLGAAYRGAVTGFMGPWQNSMKELTDAMAKGLMKDPEGFLEYFNLWKKNYDETFSKMLKMPMMGISRESSEVQLHAIDSYVTVMTYLVEVLARISALANENTRNVIMKSFEDLRNGNQPKSFEEFYAFWRNSLSDAFDDLFYSDEFSKLLGTMVSAIMDLKVTMDKIMERYLSSFPVPLKSDMDSLYKTVYDLKKEVRSLKKTIEEMNKQAEAPKKASKSSK